MLSEILISYHYVPLRPGPGVELRLRQDWKGIVEQGGAETTTDASHMGHTKSL